MIPETQEYIMGVVLVLRFVVEHTPNQAKYSSTISPVNLGQGNLAEASNRNDKLSITDFVYPLHATPIRSRMVSWMSRCNVWGAQGSSGIPGGPPTTQMSSRG